MENKKNRIYKNIMLIILTAFVTFIITGCSMYTYFTNNQDLENADVKNIPAIINTSKSSDLEKYLNNIKQTIDKYYLWKDDIDEKELETGAIEGYVAALGDEYTEYIPASEMESFTEEVTGNFVGIGIYMKEDTVSNRVVVYYPIPNTPADKAGIKAGDLIISVDGIEYTAEDFSKISNYIKGEEGTKVKLVIERDGERLNYEIAREKINTNPITTKILEENIGYLKIPSFDEGTSKDFKEKVQELQSQGATKLILDLRNNGGGIVSEATTIADYLLEKGKTIISTVDNKQNKEVTNSKNDPIFTMPLVVLVNGNSASASEILVCSLQDNERAKIVGTVTYGKGVIQTVLSLTDGSGLKITTDEYYTPNGTEINKKGITPDEEVNLPETIKNKYAVEESNDTQLKKAIEILK